MDDLKGRWVLVTGASSGLGAEMTRVLAREHRAEAESRLGRQSRCRAVPSGRLRRGERTARPAPPRRVPPLKRSLPPRLSYAGEGRRTSIRLSRVTARPHNPPARSRPRTAPRFVELDLFRQRSARPARRSGPRSRRSSLACSPTRPRGCGLAPRAAEVENERRGERSQPGGARPRRLWARLTGPSPHSTSTYTIVWLRRMYATSPKVMGPFIPPVVFPSSPPYR